MTAPVSSDLTWLGDLERAHAAATPGPWHVAPGGGIDAGDYDTVIGRGDVNCMAHCYGGTSTIEGDNLTADAALIVAAVNAVPTLIAELRKRDAALQAVLDKCDRMEREAREDHTGDPNDAATVRANALHFAAHNLRAALTAALSPESVPS